MKKVLAGSQEAREAGEARSRFGGASRDVAVPTEAGEDGNRQTAND